MSRAKPQIWQHFGLNVGNNIGEGGVYDLVTIQAEAQYHKDISIPYVRIGAPGYKFTFGSPAGMAKTHAIIETYLNLGISVQYVLSYGSGFNMTHEADYKAYVRQEAAYFQSVGGQRLQLENELELNDDGSMTDAQVRDYVLTLPAEAIAGGFTGQKTYSLAGGIYAWTTKGGFDDIGLDTYVEFQGLQGVFTAIDLIIATFGADAYVSEWGAYQNNYDVNPRVQADNMLAILNYIKSRFTRPCYMFTWKQTNDAYAAKTLVGDLRLFWYEVTNQKPPIVKYPHDKVSLHRPQFGTFDINKLGGKTLWLKADSGVYKDAGITSAADQDTVQQWNDFSGQGNHAIQATEFKKPALHTNIQNGLPSVFFNAGNFNILQCLNASNFNLDTPTLFVVGKWSAGSAFLGKNDSNLSTAARRKLELLGSDSTHVRFYSGTDAQSHTLAATMTDWNIFMIQGLLSSLVNVNINGVDNISKPINNSDFQTFNTAPLVIGAGFYNNGGAEFASCDIGEIILFDRILPDYQYKNVINYLSNKWGISVTNTVPAVIPARGARVSR